MALKGSRFSRAANFSNYEEEVLVSLVNRYKSIIECKITDGASNQEKKDAWDKLANDFNTNCGGQYRTVEILRRKYDNIKKRAKQRFADEKVKIMGTGGGPYVEEPISNVDSKIKDILDKSMTGVTSHFDDDKELDMSMDIPAIEEDFVDLVDPDSYEDKYEILTITGGAGPSSEQSVSTDWSKYTPKMLTTKKSEALQHKISGNEEKSGKSLEKKLCNWTNGKLDLVEVQKQCMLEEHRQKLALAREKHEKAMEREDRESAARIRAIEEEHQMKKEILLLQKQKYMN